MYDVDVKKKLLSDYQRKVLKDAYKDSK